jgi:hypothetical protein
MPRRRVGGALLAVLVWLGAQPATVRADPDSGTARRRQYLFGFRDPDRHRSLRSRQEIWPGFPSERVRSGILVDILGGARGFIRDNGTGLPEYSGTTPGEMAQCLWALSAASVRPLEYLEAGAEYAERAAARVDSLAGGAEPGKESGTERNAAEKAEVLLAAVPYQELADGESAGSVPPMVERLFYCGALSRTGEADRPLTLVFTREGLIADGAWDIESVTVEQGGFLGTIAFPGELTLPRLDPEKLIRIQVHGEGRKGGESGGIGGMRTIYIDPKAG